MGGVVGVTDRANGGATWTTAIIATGGADPLGAAIYSWIKTGELKSEGNSITEGIGQGRHQLGQRRER